MASDPEEVFSDHDEEPDHFDTEQNRVRNSLVAGYPDDDATDDMLSPAYDSIRIDNVSAGESPSNSEESVVVTDNSSDPPMERGGVRRLSVDLRSTPLNTDTLMMPLNHDAPSPNTPFTPQQPTAPRGGDSRPAPIPEATARRISRSNSFTIQDFNRVLPPGAELMGPPQEDASVDSYEPDESEMAPEPQNFGIPVGPHGPAGHLVGRMPSGNYGNVLGQNPMNPNFGQGMPPMGNMQPMNPMQPMPPNRNMQPMMFAQNLPQHGPPMTGPPHMGMMDMDMQMQNQQLPMDMGGPPQIRSVRVGRQSLRPDEQSSGLAQQLVNPQHRPNKTVTRPPPERFRGPARISNVQGYVPPDPLEGDTEVSAWSVGDVTVWCKSLEGQYLREYAQKFSDHHIDGRCLLTLKEDDLEHALGITSLGHRRRLMEAIIDLQERVIVEIDTKRYLIPAHGVVIRFEEICVFTRIGNAVTPTLLHVSGTCLPNQVTVLMGSEPKTQLLRVLAGFGLDQNVNVTGHVFVNGNPMSGSLCAHGVASYVSFRDSYDNFIYATVEDVVSFHANLAQCDGLRGKSSAELIRNVLRCADVENPKTTLVSDLSVAKFRRLLIAIDVLLYDIKLLFLEEPLAGLGMEEGTEVLQWVYAYSRQLDCTVIMTMERPRYTLMIAFFDQVFVIGDTVIDESSSTIPTNVRFCGRADQCVDYFRRQGIDFKIHENPVEIIHEAVGQDPDLAFRSDAEPQSFRYRAKRSEDRDSNQETTVFKTVHDRLSVGSELYYLLKFMLKSAWTEWSLVRSVLRLLFYCMIISAVFWHSDCSSGYFDERIMAVYLLCCMTVAVMWPMCDYYFRHRRWWLRFLAFNRRIRTLTFGLALILLCLSHALLVATLSLLPWFVERLSPHSVGGGISTTPVISIWGVSLLLGLIFGVYACFAAEVSMAKHVNVMMPFLVHTILFSGAFVDPRYLTRVGRLYVWVDFMKYGLESLLWTDWRHLLGSPARCQSHLTSISERMFVERPQADYLILVAYFLAVCAVFIMFMSRQVQNYIDRSSQLTIGRLSPTEVVSNYVFTRPMPDLTFPSLPSSPQGGAPQPPEDYPGRKESRVRFSAINNVHTFGAEEQPELIQSQRTSTVAVRDPAYGDFARGSEIVETPTTGGSQHGTRGGSLSGASSVYQRSISSHPRRSSFLMRQSMGPHFLQMEDSPPVIPPIPGIDSAATSNFIPVGGFSAGNTPSRHSNMNMNMNMNLNMNVIHEETFEEKRMEEQMVGARMSRPIMVGNMDVGNQDMTDPVMLMAPFIFHNLSVKCKKKEDARGAKDNQAASYESSFIHSGGSPIASSDYIYMFRECSGRIPANAVTILVGPQDCDIDLMIRVLCGYPTDDENLIVEGTITIEQHELRENVELVKNQIVGHVPSHPIVPHFLRVKEIVRLSLILMDFGESSGDGMEFEQQGVHELHDVEEILTRLDLFEQRDLFASQLSDLDHLKVAIIYNGMRSAKQILFVENVFDNLSSLDQIQLIGSIRVLSELFGLAVCVALRELPLEAVDLYVDHIIAVAPLETGCATIYEGTVSDSIEVFAQYFPVRRFENIVDEIVDVCGKVADPDSSEGLTKMRDDMIRVSALHIEYGHEFDLATFLEGKNRKFLEYWWLGWLYWRYFTSNPRLFLWAIIRLNLQLLLWCLAFWNVPSTVAGSRTMFGAMSAILFVFILQTPWNFQLFVPLLKLGVQDWNHGKYTLTIAITLHCWMEYVFGIVLALPVSLLAYYSVNFHDPDRVVGYSILLFALGFVYSSGVWDSIYFILFSMNYSETVSYMLMGHLVVYFGVFSGSFILSSNLPAFVRYLGYYVNPVRLTLESQYCVVVLPKTFGDKRGADIVANSGYDCAIGFDLAIVFLITTIARLIGALVLRYRFKKNPFIALTQTVHSNVYIDEQGRPGPDVGRIQQDPFVVVDTPNSEFVSQHHQRLYEDDERRRQETDEMRPLSSTAGVEDPGSNRTMISVVKSFFSNVASAVGSRRNSGSDSRRSSRRNSQQREALLQEDIHMDDFSSRQAFVDDTDDVDRVGGGFMPLNVGGGQPWNNSPSFDEDNILSTSPNPVSFIH